MTQTQHAAPPEARLGSGPKGPGRKTPLLLILLLAASALAPVAAADVDGDGVPTAIDCDDNDELVLNNNTQDADCDEVATLVDCDDESAAITYTNLEDSDCDESANGDDCDDSNATINPSADEVAYDGIDNDCADGDLVDVDADGYDGEAAGGTDCDDEDMAIHPNATELAYDAVDDDCDGTDLADVDADGFEGELAGGPDCADEDAAIHPEANETPYDTVDDDCSGADLTDVDGDGFDSIVVVDGTDCDDTDDAIHPGATEIPYDDVDDDCDGWDLTDADTDGFDGLEADGTDCDDEDATVSFLCLDADDDGHYGATACPVPELASDDESVNWTQYAFLSDAFDAACVPSVAQESGLCGTGTIAISGTEQCGLDGTDGCDPFVELLIGDQEDTFCGYVLDIGTDCDDGDAERWTLDATDDADPCLLDLDADGDGYHNATDSGSLEDCVDGNATIHPGADEAAGNDIDEDCDGFAGSEDGTTAANRTLAGIEPDEVFELAEGFLLTFASDATLTDVTVTLTAADGELLLASSDVEELLAFAPDLDGVDLGDVLTGRVASRPAYVLSLDAGATDLSGEATLDFLVCVPEDYFETQSGLDPDEMRLFVYEDGALVDNDANTVTRSDEVREGFVCYDVHVEDFSAYVLAGGRARSGGGGGGSSKTTPTPTPSTPAPSVPAPSAPDATPSTTESPEQPLPADDDAARPEPQAGEEGQGSPGVGLLALLAALAVALVAVRRKI